MSREFDRQLRDAMKNLSSGSIPTTDYSIGETFAQGDLKFPSAPQFSMPKPRELGINRDFSGNKMSLYFQNIAKSKGPKKKTIENINQRIGEGGEIFGEEMTASKKPTFNQLDRNTLVVGEPLQATLMRMLIALA
jgi:hypothetical protein